MDESDDELFGGADGGADADDGAGATSMAVLAFAVVVGAYIDEFCKLG